jgi:hypothetical protein
MIRRKPDMHETFWTLLRDRAHWEFELFLMVVFDIFLAGVWQLFLRRKDKVQSWAMNPVAVKAGHKIQTPKGICEQCGGLVKHMIESGIKWCLGCGEIKVLSESKEEGLDDIHR